MQDVNHQGMDLMTRLPSREVLCNQLNYWLRKNTDKSSNCSVLMLGINNFSAINEIYGHSVGDRALVNTARRLRRDFREPDMVGRYSGAVFCVVLPDCHDVSKLQLIANRLLNLCSKPIEIDEQSIYLSVSIGASNNALGALEGDDLILQADMALRDLKKRGVQDFRLFHPDLSKAISRRLKSESLLFEAIHQQCFELHYQPVFDINEHSIVGVESLLRLRLENGELIFPNDFIALAEESGLIVNIGQWVMKKSCEKIAAWREQFASDLKIMVNVSAWQLRMPDFSQFVLDTLAENGLPTSALELELTERQLVHDANVVLQTLDELREQGVCISIDDFGTGYSSLAYLRQLPVDVLKVDREFLNDVPQNAIAVEVVSSIINLAAKLNLKVVIEGIENEAQKQYLKQCDNLFGQGYHLGRPVDVKSIELQLGEIQNRRTEHCITPEPLSIVTSMEKAV